MPHPVSGSACRKLLNTTLWLILVILASARALPAAAAGLDITNVSLINRDDEAGTIDVQFDITWKRSWRLSDPPYNWDAVWVFVKFRHNKAIWKHASLTATGHYAPAGFNIELGAKDYLNTTSIPNNPGIGAFIYRSAPGSGTVNLSGVRLIL